MTFEQGDRIVTPLRYLAAFAVLLLGTGPIGPGFAQDLSTADMVKALKPKAKVRAFTLDQMARESRQNDVVVSLQREKTRGITIEEKDEIAAVIEEGNLPEVDLDVFFATDSTEISAEAAPVLETLGAALNDAQLKSSVFLVAGYADAEEADGIAEERAQVVRDFLIGKAGIDPGRLVAVGFDEDQLKNKGAPLAEGNRKVRVVNMATRQAKASE
jgi:flagellar motor protein MotB